MKPFAAYEALLAVRGGLRLEALVLHRRHLALQLGVPRRRLRAQRRDLRRVVVGQCLLELLLQLLALLLSATTAVSLALGRTWQQRWQ